MLQTGRGEVPYELLLSNQSIVHQPASLTAETPHGAGEALCLAVPVPNGDGRPLSWNPVVLVAVVPAAVRFLNRRL
jgi:hypothetical protein